MVTTKAMDKCIELSSYVTFEIKYSIQLQVYVELVRLFPRGSDNSKS